MKKKKRVEENKATGSEFVYQIGDKTYIQKAMVLGQVKSFTDLLKTFDMPEKLDVLELVSVLGDRLPEALAVVLIEKGSKTPLKDRDIKKIAEELSNTIDTNTVLQVMDDFFACNPIAYIMEKMSNIMIGMGYRVGAKDIMNETLNTEMTSTGSTESSSISQGETSSEEMKSVGGTH